MSATMPGYELAVG